ncbi:MAG: glycogen synthase [Bacteroidetes bacterium]|uniref:glycogen synthase n=1 Tax=Phnomibacter sp. TaxID=2836217 RepID=UPI002FDE8B45|nr:glycogen synthase [Bacteroidota bacterium]
MEIVHISAECYPVAKAGGLGDVVGALPKYQQQLGHLAKVVMPMYRSKYLYNHEWELVHESGTYLGNTWFRYAVIKEKTNELGFDLYLLDINGLLDREKVYGYDDDTERFTAFQIAVVHWLATWEHRPDVVHVHDHHTGLIPFMMKYCYAYQSLRSIKTVFTIHNGQYQGWMGWNKSHYLPSFDNWKSGMLEWKDSINALAAAVKCADKVTTVSQSYMEELRIQANGLEDLFEYEKGKCSGILNGIDTEVWDPETDPLLPYNYGIADVVEGKELNKKSVCQHFGLDADKPLFIFIGRLVGEKAAEILPSAIGEAAAEFNGALNFIVLGSGDPKLEYELQALQELIPNQMSCYIGYNEKLAHQLYAAADFLLMPSRVEPCGLNQMYALRYGTVPMVRNTGGLRDTVIDIGAPNFTGYGLVFEHPSVGDLKHAIHRAASWYFEKPDILLAARQKMMAIDNSWTKSAAAYIDLYKS